MAVLELGVPEEMKSIDLSSSRVNLGKLLSPPHSLRANQQKTAEKNVATSDVSFE